MQIATLAAAAASTLNMALFGNLATLVRSGFLYVAWPSVSHMLKLPRADYMDCLLLCIAAEALAPRLAKTDDAPRARQAEHPDALIAAAMRRSG